MTIPFSRTLAASVMLGHLVACATSAPPVVSLSPVGASPAAAASAATTRVALVNPGFESAKPGVRGDPEGWFSFQHAGDLSYRYTVDPAERRSGMQSLRIDNIGPEPYGAVAQSINGAIHVGNWKRYTITLPVPKGADRVEVGAMMRGKGSLWFDDPEIEFVAP